MLVQDDLHLAHVISSITQITEADQIAKAMVIIFQDNNKALSLLQAFIDEEVKNTGNKIIHLGVTINSNFRIRWYFI